MAYSPNPGLSDMKPVFPLPEFIPGCLCKLPSASGSFLRLAPALTLGFCGTCLLQAANPVLILRETYLCPLRSWAKDFPSSPRILVCHHTGRCCSKLIRRPYTPGMGFCSGEMRTSPSPALLRILSQDPHNPVFSGKWSGNMASQAVAV